MHERYIFLVDNRKYRKNKALKGARFKDSLDVRQYVESYLDENGFASEGARWGGARGDWYVIGGRWSGTLQYLALHPLLIAAFEESLPDFYSEKETKALVAKFRKVFPKWKGETIWERGRLSAYSRLGAEDDAVLVTKEFWSYFLKAALHEMKGDDYEDTLMLIDNELDGLTKRFQFIDKVWAVIVDLHS